MAVRHPEELAAQPQPPPAAFDMPLPGIAQWGKMVSLSRDGGKSVFVQDFGKGHLVVTHVTWTMEVAEQLRSHRDLVRGSDVR